MLEALKVIILGIVEGITEWLPISSTGHLILVEEFVKLNFSQSYLDMFNVVIQLGAIMAVVVIYFHRLNPFSPKKTEKQKKMTLQLWVKVVIASIPAGVVGILFNDFIEEPERYTMKNYLKENKNLFILKAFTKIYAMAGLRLGYGLSSDERLLKKMTSVSQPWAVSIPAQIAGVQALKEKEYLKKTEELIRKESNYLKEALRKLNMKIYGSKANYIFFKDEDGHELKAYLENRGIMIRDCSNYVGLTKGYYRICVKEHKDNKRLINEIISFRGM